MGEKYYSLFLLLFIAAFIRVNAQDAPVLTFNIPYQNNLMYNRFLMNPAFSFVRENNTYLSLYHRNQWVQFDDSPKVYLLTYTGKFSDKAGMAFGLYKQNIGVISNFGGIANYSYNVRLMEKMDLTLGFNVVYYNSGVDKNRAITGQPDPIIIEMQSNSMVSIKPGFNLNYKEFDLGFYMENFVDYDFRSNGMAKAYTNKTYSGHLMYTYKMLTMKNLFENGELKATLRAKSSEEYGFGISSSLLVNFPRMGWVQAGVDDFYGIGIGLGFHFTKRLSLGYTYETTVKEGLSNLGPSHEITMVFAIRDRLAVGMMNPVKKDTLAQMDEMLKDSIQEKAKDSIIAKKKADKKAEAGFDKKSEIEKLKMDLDESDKHLLDALIAEDSITELRKADFEKKVKNLKDYAQREKEARKEGGIKTIELKNTDNNGEMVEPRTLEDLKKSKEGYYVVSKPKESKKEDDPLLIEKHPTFVEAANATEIKKKKGKEKDIYIVHVDNAAATPEETEAIKKADAETEEEVKPQKSRTASRPKEENKAKEESKPKSIENLKTEQEIKDFYAHKTDKPRQAPKKGNKLMVDGVDPGYYIIANVFSEQENTDKFIKKMKDRGIDAGFFSNPENGFRYVYLKKHYNWRDALISYYSNVNNTYFESVWLMSINTN
jgi:type IX secretion system PorP/SprF family membrane protein